MRAVVAAGACLLVVSAPRAQSSSISGAESPAASLGAAATDPAATDRTAAMRARLEQIPRDRHALEEQWRAAMVQFELSRAARIQVQIQALDGEKAGLERELASSAVAAP